MNELANFLQVISFFFKLVLFLIISLLLMCGLVTDWVNTDSKNWGLWSWCYKKEVYEALVVCTAALKNNISRCHTIDPGESPAYYEVARFFFVLSIVLSFCVAITTFAVVAESSIVKLVVDAVFEALLCLSSAIVLGVLGTYYKDDHRWKDANPSLGGYFWAFASLFGLYALLSYCFTFAYSLDVRCNKKKTCTLAHCICTKCPANDFICSYKCPANDFICNYKCPTSDFICSYKCPANDIICSYIKKKMSIVYAKFIRSAIKYLSFFCHRSKHSVPISNPAIVKSLEGPTNDQPGRSNEAHSPPFGHVGEHAAGRPTDNKDRSSSAWHQQDGQEPSSGHSADVDSPSVHCISQAQHLPTDSHRVIDSPNNALVFQFKRVEDRIEIVPI